MLPSFLGMFFPPGLSRTARTLLYLWLAFAFVGLALGAGNAAEHGLSPGGASRLQAGLRMFYRRVEELDADDVGGFVASPAVKLPSYEYV